MEPQKYASHDDVHRDSLLEMINEFAEEMGTMSGKCMDVGYEPGDMTKEMLLPALDTNAVMIDTDISKDMIEYVNKVYGEKGKIEFEILDIQTKNLPVKYISEFNHIFSFHTLQLCCDTRQVLENMYRMLRPGGTILLLGVSSGTIIDILKDMFGDTRYASYLPKIETFIWRFYDSPQINNQVKELLRSIGFKVQHCSQREIIVKHPNSLLESVLAYIPVFWDKIPRDKRDEFNDEVRQKYWSSVFYKEVHAKEKEKISIDKFRALLIYAEKTE